MQFLKKNLLKLINLFVIILNIVALFYMFSFYEEYVYNSIVTDEDYIAEKSKQVSGDINIEKFNITLEQLSIRGKTTKDKNIVNIFE